MLGWVCCVREERGDAKRQLAPASSGNERASACFTPRAAIASILDPPARLCGRARIVARVAPCGEASVHLQLLVPFVSIFDSGAFARESPFIAADPSDCAVLFLHLRQRRRSKNHYPFPALLVSASGQRHQQPSPWTITNMNVAHMPEDAASVLEQFMHDGEFP